jgi:hypothetical protein
MAFGSVTKATTTLSAGWDAFNQLITDLLAVTSGKGASQIGILDAAEQITAVNVEDAITEMYSTFSQTVAGTYTGDGTTSQAITGLGFTPKYVRIWPVPTSGGATIVFEKTDDMGVYAFYDDPDQYTSAADMIISLDADGFTVDDNAADANPNKNDQAYCYLAIS